MFFYEGQHCPVCGEAFAETDDIVSCPVCGAPHHRSCWQAAGHCHFEETHGTDAQWKREAEPTTEEAGVKNRCPNCGTDNLEHAEFCSHCGRALEAEEWNSAGPVPPVGPGVPYEYSPFRVFDPLAGVPREEKFDEDVTAEDLALCVAGNTTYYLPRFQKMKNGRPIQWNWTACFITPYWLLYRKQYAAGTLVSLFYLAFNLLINMIFQLSGVTNTNTEVEVFNKINEAGFFPPMMILCLGVLAVSVLFGMFGNRLYMSSCIKKVQQAKAENPDDVRGAIRQAGGVSFIWGAVAYFSISFFSSVLSFILLLR
ncbi:MAG: DUF2628 domain-containing protein [Clostridia bacterium]|nr:DUF2628 domain-containing protein [Clostridia bacterium]